MRTPLFAATVAYLNHVLGQTRPMLKAMRQVDVFSDINWQKTDFEMETMTAVRSALDKMSKQGKEQQFPTYLVLHPDVV